MTCSQLLILNYFFQAKKNKSYKHVIFLYKDKEPKQTKKAFFN